LTLDDLAAGEVPAPERIGLNASVFADLPAFAGWRFVDVVDGFEVVYTQPDLLRGHTSAVEDTRSAR
jgi:hypothetical protein